VQVIVDMHADVGRHLVGLSKHNDVRFEQLGAQSRWQDQFRLVHKRLQLLVVEVFLQRLFPHYEDEADFAKVIAVRRH
jgi:hypothetical protein